MAKRQSKTKKNAPKDTTPPEILFHYQKAEDFRVIEVEGVYGGISPRGKIHVALFNERKAIPKTVRKRYDPSTMMITGEDEIVDSIEGIVRQLEVSFTLDLETAESVVRWLSEKIKQLKVARREAEKMIQEGVK